MTGCCDPLNFVEEYISKFSTSPEVNELPRFCGGLAGYFGYDVVRLLEPRLKRHVRSKEHSLFIPDILLLEVREMIVFDNYTGELTLIVFANPEEKSAFQQAEKKLDLMEASLSKTLTIPELGGTGYRDH